MRKYYLAERLKNCHTSVGKMMLLMPLVTVCLAASLTADYFTIDCYNWWYIILFPGMIAFICAAVGNRDKKADSRTILTLPADLGAVWDGKVLYGIRSMGIALLVLFGAVLCFSVGFEQIAQRGFHINLSISQHVQAIVVLFVTSLWQIPFCLLLHQIIGKFLMILVHMGSYFILAIELSLQPFFMVLPGGITARMMCRILRILPNGLVAEPGSITFTSELLEWKALPLGIAVSLMWFLLLWIISRRWFKTRIMR